MNRLLFAMLLCVAVTTEIVAQQQVSDENLHKQLNSIAGSEWDFGPAWQYWLFHSGYSGASLKYKFPFSFKVKFDEEKANVKRLWRPQQQQIAAAMLLKNEAQKQNDNITEIYDEQMKVYLDRMNPVAQTIYDDEFKEFQKYMEMALTYVLTKSNGRAVKAVNRLKRQYDIIVDEYDYVTALTPTAGAVVSGAMESGAREKELERIFDEMTDLAKQTKDIVNFCKLAY